MKYFEILGLEPEANDDDIKYAFRRLAQQYHPDKPRGDLARFQEINKAYEVLSDPVLRGKYMRGEQNFKTQQAMIEESVVAQLLLVFSKMIESLDMYNVEQFDFRGHILHSINDSFGKIAEQFIKNANELKKLKIIKRRIRGGSHIFIDHIREKRLTFLKKQKELKFHKKVAKRALEVVETLDYDFDKIHRVILNNAGSFTTWTR